MIVADWKLWLVESKVYLIWLEGEQLSTLAVRLFFIGPKPDLPKALGYAMQYFIHCSGRKFRRIGYFSTYHMELACRYVTPVDKSELGISRIDR